MTNTQLRMRKAAEAAAEMQVREKYGPRRIETEALARKAENGSGGEGKARRKEKETACKIRQDETGHDLGGKGIGGGQEFGEFGEIPDNRFLRPAGHGKIDCSVRFVMKGSGFYDVLSSYGTLRITPVAPNVVRICFAKGQCKKFPAPVPEYAGKSARCTVRESAAAVDISTDKMTLRVEKKSGAFSLLTRNGKVVLSERAKEPRQIGEQQCWAFFDWKKDENLIAKAPANTDKKVIEIGALAKYISFGKESGQMPGLASPKGYEILFPAGGKVLCCNIPMYGNYVSLEGVEILDYYILVKA